MELEQSDMAYKLIEKEVFINTPIIDGTTFEIYESNYGDLDTSTLYLVEKGKQLRNFYQAFPSVFKHCLIDNDHSII